MAKFDNSLVQQKKHLDNVLVYTLDCIVDIHTNFSCKVAKSSLNIASSLILILFRLYL